jgi:hypothetical protein
MIDLTEQQSTDTGLDLSAGIKTNAVSPDHLEYKTERYSRALEDTPYTPEKIRNLLASPGGEESLRNMASMQESMDRREAMNAVLKSQEDINIVRAAAEKAAQPVNTSTVIEKRYSEKIHAETMSYGDLNLLREAEEGNPKVVDALYEISVQQSMRTEGFRAVLQEAQKRTQETSWGSYAGQFAKSLIPTYSWTTQSSPSLGEKLPSSLSGTNVEKQYDVLWAMPPEQAIPLAKQIYEEIYASSTIEAQTWAEGLNDYSAGDSQFNNLMGVLDVASVTPLGAARKVLRKGVKGTVKEAVAYPAKLLKRTVEVASDPRATVQNKMAGTGRVLT